MQTLQKQIEIKTYNFTNLSVCDLEGLAFKKYVELITSISVCCFEEKYFIKIIFNDEIEYLLEAYNREGFLFFSEESFAQTFILQFMEASNEIIKEYRYWLNGDLSYFENKQGQLASMIRQTDLFFKQHKQRYNKETVTMFKWTNIDKTKRLLEYLAVIEEIFICKEQLKKLGLNYT